jgi:hypothetical protein
MGESLSITLISALPENELQQTEKEIPISESKSTTKAEEVIIEIPELVTTIREKEIIDDSIDKLNEANEVKSVFSIYDEITELKQELPEVTSPMPIESGETSLQNSITPIDEADKNQKEIPSFIASHIPEIHNEISTSPLTGNQEITQSNVDTIAKIQKPEPLTASIKIDTAHAAGQAELSFDNAPKGRFEGENPNVFEGEDLDLPPFLRKKRS